MTTLRTNVELDFHFIVCAVASLVLVAALVLPGCTKLGDSSGPGLDAAADDAGDGDGDGDGDRGGDGDGDGDGDGYGDGDGDGYGDSGVTGSGVAPTVVIEFPMTGRTAASQITVRGTAHDADGDLASVSIGGEAVALADDGTFSVRRSLAQGLNTLEVQAADAAGRTSAVASVTVERAALRLWRRPLDIAINSWNDEALLIDGTFEGLYGVDLTTGDSRVIADSSTGDGASLYQPKLVEMDHDGNRAIVLYGDDMLALIDLQTLARSTVSLSLGELYILDMVYDRHAETLFAVGGDAVFTVDFTTGLPTVISDDGNAAQGVPLQAGSELALGDSDLFVVHQTSGALFSIARATGNRTPLPAGSGPSVTSPVSLAYDPFNGLLFIGDQALEGIVKMTLDGVRTVLASREVGSGPPLGHAPQAMALMSDGRVLVADWRKTAFVLPQRGKLTWVDRANGHRSYVPFGIGSGPGLGEPMAIQADAARDRVLVVDGSAGALVSIHLETGNRFVISDAITGTGPALEYPAGLALDLANDRAFVADNHAEAIVSIDLSSGDRTFLSNNDGVGSGAELGSPSWLLFDSARQQLYVLDHDANGAGRIVSIDAASGNRLVRSDITRDGPALSYAQGLAPGADPDTLIAAVENNVVRIDLESGDRAYLREDGVDASRAIVTGLASDDNGWISSYIHLGGDDEDPVTSGLFNGDFEGGEPVQLSDALNSGQGPAPSLWLWGGPMTLLGDIVLVSQTDVGAIVAIDRVSGDRVIVSM